MTTDLVMWSFKQFLNGALCLTSSYCSNHLFTLNFILPLVLWLLESSLVFFFGSVALINPKVTCCKFGVFYDFFRFSGFLRSSEISLKKSVKYFLETSLVRIYLMKINTFSMTFFWSQRFLFLIFFFTDGSGLTLKMLMGPLDMHYWLLGVPLPHFENHCTKSYLIWVSVLASHPGCVPSWPWPGWSAC